MGGRRAASFTARDSLSFFSRRPAPAEPFPGSPPVFLLETSMGPSSFSCSRYWASFPPDVNGHAQRHALLGPGRNRALCQTAAVQKDVWKKLDRIRPKTSRKETGTAAGPPPVFLLETPQTSPAWAWTPPVFLLETPRASFFYRRHSGQFFF